MTWCGIALNGERLGRRRPESRVDEHLPRREVKDRLEIYSGVPVLRGRIVVVPLAVGRESSQLGDEGSVLGSEGPLDGALQQMLRSMVHLKDWLRATARALNVLEQVEVGDPQTKNGVLVFEGWPRENLRGGF